jgi:hypothetical protein
MTLRAKFFSHVGHSTPGKLLRALLAAQQLAGVCQMPAIKALSAMTSPPVAVHAGATTVADPALARIGYPGGPPPAGRPGLCGPVFEPVRAAAEKYHGELHARYRDVRSVSTP